MTAAKATECWENRMTILPPDAQHRLDDAMDRRHFLTLGPVMRESVAPLCLLLADTGAEAVVHDQQDLAVALAGALLRCQVLPPTVREIAQLP